MRVNFSFAVYVMDIGYYYLESEFIGALNRS